MNLENLKKKLQPKAEPFEIQGEIIYIHRPTLNDIPKCDNTPNTIVNCVKDENGDPIFSLEEIEGRININMMDSTYVTEIYLAIVNLYEDSDQVDEIEKK